MATTFAKPPKNILHRSVTIEAVFGSDIQRDVAMRVLGEFLVARRSNVDRVGADV
jgi:hypothetical protein